MKTPIEDEEWAREVRDFLMEKRPRPIPELQGAPVEIELEDGAVVIGTIAEFRAMFEPVVIPARDIKAMPTMPITFSTTIVTPRIRWWTKLWCSLYWGHRPVRCDASHGDFMWDYLRCRCGKVAMPREEVAQKLDGIGSGPLGLSLR